MNVSCKIVIIVYKRYQAYDRILHVDFRFSLGK